MASTMTLEDARTVLEKLGYKKAGKFTVKQAQEKIDEVLESPDDFEGDAKKVKEKEVKKLIDTIWDAVEDEDEIEVVEEEEDEEEDDDDEEEASDDDDDDSDDDDDDEDSDDDDEEDEPVKKKGKKGKAAKAESNGKAKKKKQQPPQRSVERDNFNRSINSGSHVINVVLERAKGPMTLGEITKAAKTVGKELGIKPRPTINRYLQRMIRLEQLEADGRGDERTFVLADGKPRKKVKTKASKSKDDDADEKPAKKGKTGKKVKAGKK